MTIMDSPTRAELVRRAAEIVPRRHREAIDSCAGEPDGDEAEEAGRVYDLGRGRDV